VISLRARELRNLTAEDLAQRLVETRKELFNIRFQAATGALEDISRLRQTRREIARILTIQSELAKQG
jgi:large subunit ribosomal protein L29